MTAEPPPDEEPAVEPPDLVDVLTAEHRTVEGLFADIETTADRRLRRETLAAVMAELKRHSGAEERFLYPTTRDSLSAGQVLADHNHREHADENALMQRISALDDTDPALDPLVDTLMSDVRHHVVEEETELFPRLRAACDPETLRKLGDDATKLR